MDDKEYGRLEYGRLKYGRLEYGRLEYGDRAVGFPLFIPFVFIVLLLNVVTHYHR